MQSWREGCEKYVCLQGDYVKKRLHFQLPVVSSFFKIYNKLGDLRTWTPHTRSRSPLRNGKTEPGARTFSYTMNGHRNYFSKVKRPEREIDLSPPHIVRMPSWHGYVNRFTFSHRKKWNGNKVPRPNSTQYARTGLRKLEKQGHTATIFWIYGYVQLISLRIIFISHTLSIYRPIWQISFLCCGRISVLGDRDGWLLFGWNLNYASH